jgi:hypothetical protein
VNFLIVTRVMKAVDAIDRWLPTVPLPFDGLGIAFVAFFADILFLVVAHCVRWLGVRGILREIAHQEQQLATLKMEDEFAKCAKIKRSVKSCKARIAAGRMPAVVWILRNVLPAIFLRRGVVCEFPADFWWPITRFVTSAGAPGKIGFAFFWNVMLAPVDMQLFEWARGVLVARGYIASLEQGPPARPHGVTAWLKLHGLW